jgi:hypothetical protein
VSETRTSTLETTSSSLVNSVGGLLTLTASTQLATDQLLLDSASHNLRLANLEVDSVAALNQTAGLQAATNQTIGLTRYLKEQVDHIYVLLEGLFHNDTVTLNVLNNLTTRMEFSESNYTDINNEIPVINGLLYPVYANLTVTSAVASGAEARSVDSAARVIALENQATYADLRCVSLVLCTAVGAARVLFVSSYASVTRLACLLGRASQVEHNFDWRTTTA